MKKKLLAIALCVTMLFSTVQQVVIATGDVAADTSSVVSEMSENDESGTESYPESQVSTEETSTEESATESETSTEESSEAETSQESSTSETSETNTDEQTSNSGNKIESGLANLMNQLIKPLSAASLASTYDLSAGTATSTDAAVYPDLTTSPAYQNYQDFRERYDSSKSFIMPGMTSTYLSSSSSCDEMVPQGFCIAQVSDTEKYMLVSAYCGKTKRDHTTGEYVTPTTTSDKNTYTHKHQSVVYVLNADTGEYMTTMVLPTYGHVGGIGYDGQNLFYGISYNDKQATNTERRVNCINFNYYLSNIRNHDQVINATQSPRSSYAKLAVMPDCINFINSDNELWVSEFVMPMNAVSNRTSSTNNQIYNPGYSRVVHYSINQSTGGMTNNGSYYIPCDRIQGITVVGDYIVVSRSYIRNPNTASYISMIEFYYKDSSKTITVNGQTCQKPTGHCLVMPSMVEGVAYYNNRLYVTFESPATTYSNCESRVDRIVALDISADLAYLNEQQPEYTRVIDLGMVTTIGGATALEGDSDGYEQVALDDTYTLAVDGAVYKYNASSGQKVYCYNSKVNNGEKLLVRLHDGFDLVNTAKTSGGTTYTGEGFKVASGGTLEIRSVQSINMTGGYGGDTATSTPADKAGEVVIRRNAFGSQTYNSTFTAAVVTAESGATVKITSQNPVSSKGKHAQVVFKGGTSNYVECTDAMVSIKGGSCYMDGVTFRQIQGTTTNTHTAITATGDYTSDSVQIINCNFEDIYPVRSTTGTGDGAAVLFDTDYNSPTTLLENCTFDNSYTHTFKPELAIANPVYYAAVRYDGGVAETDTSTNNIEFKNLTFKNFANVKNADGTIAEKTAPKKGIIGFSNINWLDGVCTRTPKQLSNITIDGITMQNCETRDSVNNSITPTGETEQTHYDGPLTFAKKIQKVDIKGNVLFQDCKAWGAGAIAFDIDSVISDKVSISGSGVNRGDSANTDGTVKFVNCTGYKNGGAIGIYGENNVEAYKTRGIYENIAIDNVIIDGCTSTNGSAIMIYNYSAVKTMTLTNSVIRNCHSYVHQRVDGNYVTGSNYSGTIRTTGPVSCALTIENCDILNNDVWKDGGGIYWNAKGSEKGKTASITPKLTVKNSNIYDNQAAESGGGIYCEADMVLENLNIYNNTAGEDGGGICQTVYNNSRELLLLTQTNLSLDSGVKVYKNTARYNGGGVAMVFRYSDNAYATQYTDPITGVQTQARDYTFNFQTAQNPAIPPEIHDNVAGVYGGGVYYGTGVAANTGTSNDGVYSSTVGTMEESVSIEDLHDNVVTPTIEQKQALIASYTKNVNLYSGKIYSNKAGDCGGGIYANGANAAINVYFNEIYGNHAGFDSSTTISYKKTTSTTVGGTTYSGTSVIDTQDTIPAATNGSSDNYHGGGITLRGIGALCTVSGNTSVIRNNKAYSRGGGVYCDKSADMKIEDGGCITGNRAYAGGGVAIAIADDNVSNQQAVFTITGGNIEGNEAIKNGGGLYARGEDTVNGNTVTANINGGNIRNNKSGKDGGGVWCNSPQFDRDKTVVNINGGNVTGNKAGAALYNGDTQIDDTGACSFGGGGLYANCGTINLKNGTVENNTANNGGGGGLFIISGGLIKITGGFVRYNQATGDNTYGTMQLTSADFDKDNRYNGAGGGICVGKGYNVASEFTMPDKDDEGNTITTGRGIYGNTATFAADDVCSVGFGRTKLNIPNKSAMDLSEYNRYVVGWFEDYANSDPQYTSGTNVSNGTYSVGSRYRKNMNNTYETKYVVQNVDSSSTGAVVNSDNAYVNLTLGYTVYIDVKKVVKDPQGNLLRDNASLYNKYKDINYEFTLSRTDGTPLSAAEIKYVTINSDGTLGTTEIDATGGKFKLKDGESVRFPYLSEDVGYQVVESDNIADVYKTETACVYKDQVYDNVDNYNGTYTAATDLGDEFYANITLIDSTNGDYTADLNFSINGDNLTNVALAERLSVTLGSTNTEFKKQVWHFYHQADGSYKIKNEYNGKYLAVENYNGIDSGNTVVEDESYTDNQKWFIYTKTNTNNEQQYFFVSKAYPTIAVDCYGHTPNGEVELWLFHGNYNQLFTIDKSCGGADLATDLEDDFWARISNSYSGTKYITLNNSNAAVVADLNTNDQKQLWHFVKQSDGSYLISNGSNRYCLDNANKTDNLSTYDQFIASTENGTNAQKWFIYKQSDGIYMFRAANTIDKIMDQDTNSSQIGEWNNDSGLSNNPTQRKFAITNVPLSEVTEPSDKSAVINKLSGQTVEMTFTNYIATGKLPATGSFGIMLFQIIGFAVVVLFVALIAVRTFRKKGRYNKV